MTQLRVLPRRRHQATRNGSVIREDSYCPAIGTLRAAYNRAQRLEERRKMMQAWADFLDQLRSNGKSTREPVARDVTLVRR